MSFFTGLFQSTYDVYEGPPSWKDRLRPEISFTSPNGTLFTALWARNNRTMAKKLGIFEYPKVIGTAVQDLGVSSATYPISIFFDGPNHDINAEAFFQACKQTGKWTVIHPVKGSIDLQLVSVTEVTDVVDLANVTQFDCEWMESIDVSNIGSLPELNATITSQSAFLNDSTLSQFNNNIDQTEASGFFAVVEGVKKTVAAVSETIQKLSNGVASVNNRMIAIQRGIQDTISQPSLALLSLGGQIQTLIQLPTLATNDVSARLSSYRDLIDQVFEFSPTANTVEARNTAAVQELALLAAANANAQIVATFPASVSPTTNLPQPTTDAEITTAGLILTRDDVVGTASQISQTFIDITDNLDGVQDNFDTVSIDKQYFSQSESFPDGALITGQAVAFALKFAFDLSIERRFILKKRQSPIMITIEQYGELGENDSNFDLFIESNSLQGDRIMLLPAGTEVVIYG